MFKLCGHAKSALRRLFWWNDSACHRSVLPAGQKVGIVGCTCPMKDSHYGTYEIVCWNEEVDDYKLRRIEDGNITYAKRDCLVLV